MKKILFLIIYYINDKCGRLRSTALILCSLRRCPMKQVAGIVIGLVALVAKELLEEALDY